MQTSKHLNNTSHLHINIVSFLAKKTQFKQTLVLKKKIKRKNLTYKHKMLMVFDYENLLVIGLLQCWLI